MGSSKDIQVYLTTNLLTHTNTKVICARKKRKRFVCIRVCVCVEWECVRVSTDVSDNENEHYGVATISRLLKIISVFCKGAL